MTMHLQRLAAHRDVQLDLDMSTVRKRGNFFLNNILLMQVHGKKKTLLQHNAGLFYSSRSRRFLMTLDRQMWVGPLKVCVCLCVCMCV